MMNQGTSGPASDASISTIQQATMGPEVIRVSGAGKAYQSVAQSTAIAIQDAADNLRNVMTVSTTAIGVALAQLIETGEPQYADAIQQANTVVTSAADQFKVIGEGAAEVLNGYPTK